MNFKFKLTVISNKRVIERKLEKLRVYTTSITTERPYVDRSVACVI